MLEKARDIIEEWWLPNRRQLDRLGGVLAMTEMSDVYYGFHKSIIDAGFYGRAIPQEYGGLGLDAARDRQTRRAMIGALRLSTCE